jgi:hypothetical protein
MTDTKILAELKARKAKFGFKLEGGLYTAIFIPLGRILESLNNNKFTYSAELAGMHGTDFRLYTDDSSAADFIRVNFVKS